MSSQKGNYLVSRSIHFCNCLARGGQVGNRLTNASSKVSCPPLAVISGGFVDMSSEVPIVLDNGTGFVKVHCSHIISLSFSFMTLTPVFCSSVTQVPISLNTFSLPLSAVQSSVQKNV